MSAIVLIPARYASTRFPGKPLTLLKGRPVVQHVYENSLRSRLADDVIVATDSETIFETVLSFGGKAVVTSGDHASGTDRIAEAAASMDHDIIVNVQGDEPLIRGEMIDEVITLLDDRAASIGTLAKRITLWREVFDPNVVKVVLDPEGFAFYFSRAPIPYHRDLFGAEARRGGTEEGICTAGTSGFFMYKHIGIYSYRKDVLAALSSLPPTRLEGIERLEQLRAIENNFRIKVRETFFETMGVDTPEDLERIEKCLNSSS
ncbi:MAG: 3-deoxy-manno-octulosonate cytidylyltransferase [Candidatus Sulfobium sp.]|jgi:3-deoxy-manno-octulosonate cytidylyltransferase (CMP-KDO synthetase)